MEEKSPLLAGGNQGYPGGGYGGAPFSQPPAPYPQSGQPPVPYPQSGQPPAPYPHSGQPPAPYPQQGAGAPPQGAASGQYQGEMPEADLKDDPNARPVEPSAPSVDKMDAVSGYEHVGFSAAYLPPPSYDESQRQPPPERREFQTSTVITEEQAREALLNHVAENCCYGKNAAIEMSFKDLTSSSAFHYTLETFAEARATTWAYEPFTGQPIDGPQGGPAPGPWDIAAQAPAMFQNGKVEVEVPHTASVKPCHVCVGMGRVRCFRCHGRGRLFCGSCSGSGRQRYYENGEQHHRSCMLCEGSGRCRCYTCDGFGQITCKTCNGRTSLKCYIKLTITWTNHADDHIVERTSLPDKLIRGVSGQVSFEESQLRVWPINHFPDQEVNQASNRLVNQHATAFNNERMLMQRQRVRIIPVTEVFYKWKNDNSSFFVYGFEHKVYAPNYPQTCCCGCSIL